MDEFLQQFLIESRELVAQASDDLLALETAPRDTERFDNAFRAFHTLKGGAGIVEFRAMETAMHSAENVLTRARKESRNVSTQDVGACLEYLDLVVRWLDGIQDSGALPRDTAAGASAERVGASPLHAARADAADKSWVAALLARSGGSPRARTAVRYRPDADCFFRHEDPLARIAALPGLLAVGLEPRTAWPRLDDLDPFSCDLVIDALVAAAPAEVAASLADEARRCELEPIGGATPAIEARADEAVVAVLKAQIALLAAADGAADEGRISSAGIVAVNALRHGGESAAADALARVAASAAADRAPLKLQEAIAELLERRAVGAASGAETEAAARPAARAAAETLRVSAERVDALVRLTGELTVAKNAIGHAVQIAERDAPGLAAMLRDRHGALDRLTGELQRAVLAIRVVPFRAAFRRLPRLIRELSAELGKPAALVLEGEDTEADKAVVEALAEPLVHLLRNAMDHGVEDPAERAAAGKPAVATIVVRASRQRDHVLIEITDDGRGVNLARVREVAARRQMMSPQALAALSDAEAANLVFAPGFSTAEKVTELSGRGVGMDAVRTAITRVGGRVELQSAAGAGTTVRIVVPFSVMMTQVVTVEAVGQTFAIPLDAVVETLRIPADEIFPVGAANAIVLRDETVPLVRLTQMLGQGASMNATDSAAVVIAKVDGALGAFQVDRIGERMDIMLAPLEGLLAGLPGLAGSTLLGDGSVLLVLDLPELLQ